MRLQGTVIISDAEVSRIEGLLWDEVDEYFTDFAVYQDGSNVVVEVYSEEDTAADDTADILEYYGYYVVETILE